MRIAVRAPLTTDDDDERRTIQDGRQSRSYMGARNMPSLRWADTGPVAWRPPRWRGVVVWRCTPPGGRAVLSEVCGRFKSAFVLFRHAAPRNQHQCSRVSSRQLREIDHRFGGSSAGCADEHGVAAKYYNNRSHSSYRRERSIALNKNSRAEGNRGLWLGLVTRFCALVCSTHSSGG